MSLITSFLVDHGSKILAGAAIMVIRYIERKRLVNRRKKKNISYEENSIDQF